MSFGLIIYPTSSKTDKLSVFLTTAKLASLTPLFFNPVFLFGFICVLFRFLFAFCFSVFSDFLFGFADCLCTGMRFCRDGIKVWPFGKGIGRVAGMGNACRSCGDACACSRGKRGAHGPVRRRPEPACVRCRMVDRAGLCDRDELRVCRGHIRRFCCR